MSFTHHVLSSGDGHIAADLLRCGSDTAVLCATDLLTHRNWHERYPRLAARLAREGVSSLMFDFRGCGASSDTAVAPRSLAEDWLAVVAFVRDQGFVRLIPWGHGMLAPTCLDVQDSCIVARVMSAGTTGPIVYDWERAFGAAAMERLSAEGQVDVPSYDPTVRCSVRVTGGLLGSLAMVDQALVCGRLSQPLLCIHGDTPFDGLEPPRLARNREALARLPVGSHIHVIPGATLSFAGHIDELIEFATRWITEQLATHSTATAAPRLPHDH